MKKHPVLGATLGCTLLGASLMACGVDTAPVRSNPPIATIATSADTLASTGASTYQLYHVHRTAPGATRAFEMVARSPDGKIVHAMKVQLIKRPATGDHASGSTLPHLLIDGQGNIRETTLSPAALAIHARLGRDASLVHSEAYGCAGDVFWAVGGVLGSAGTGAAITGPVASAVAVSGDCFAQDGTAQTIDFMFEQDDPPVCDPLTTTDCPIISDPDPDPDPDWDY